jgi:2,3-bisphosphoglycerate-independent phosphoglycerate mutase
MGNSEVGHMNIGAGRIVYQELSKITKATEDGSFFANQVIIDLMDKIKAKNSKLHLLGLVSDGGVHSHQKHLYALLKMAKERGIKKVYVHAFLDGRDTPPQSAARYLQELEDEIKKNGLGQIATVSGRYYAMDRDKRWERVVKAYDVMSKGSGESAVSAVKGVEASYAKGINDEFVVPFKVQGVDGTVQAGDGMMCFNFRPDRAREITRAFVDADFKDFPRNAGSYPVDYVCMTQYDVTINAPVAFPPQDITDTLGEVVSKAGMKQLRIAETEKYAHVTFFFNGGKEAPNPGEDRVLIPSPKVATYDLQPEMSAYLVTDKLLGLLDEDKYDLIILNFANTDMVGHTGVMQAAIKAMETIDECVGSVVDKMTKLGGTVCIIADHGNLEQMEDPITHTPYTAHTTNPVPILLVGADPNTDVAPEGKLADVAPTLLAILGLPKPTAMTGKSLLVEKK